MQVHQHSQFSLHVLTKILKEKKIKADQKTQTGILGTRSLNLGPYHFISTPCVPVNKGKG